jgi:hypothetical protein
MVFHRIFVTIILICFGLILTGCQTDVYTPREACLNQIINQCKHNGWKFMNTNKVCTQAAQDGIYSLTADQLRQCAAIEKQSKSKYQGRNTYQMRGY